MKGNYPQIGLGATSIAPILGLSPFTDEHELWLELYKGIKKEFPPDTEWALQQGLYLEKGIAKWWNHFQVDALGKPLYELRSWPGTTAYYEPWPVARCRPDFVLIETDYIGGEPQVFTPCPLTRHHMMQLVEVKTFRPAQRPKWNREKKPNLEPPLHYWVQCQWQMGVTGIERNLLLGHCGDRKPYTFEIEAEPAWFENVLEYVKEWYQVHIIEGKEPV